MYLSKITYCPDHRPEMIQQLTLHRNLFHEHQMIWNLMPHDAEAKRDFLYRKDESGRLPFYYLLSERKPENIPAFLQVQSKLFTPKLTAGERCQFSLRANAVVTRKADDTSKRRIRRDIIEAKADAYKQRFNDPSDRPPSAIIHHEAGEEWLQKRGEACGFRLEQLLVSNHQFHQVRKANDKNIRQFTSLDFQGQIEITEPDVFLKQLFIGQAGDDGKPQISRGLGRSKAFGCGLMLIRKE